MPINYAFSVQNLEFFLLIFVRVSCFIYIAPFFGMPNTPSRIKVGLSIFISMLIYQFIVPHQTLDYSTVLGFAVLVLKEAIAGLLIGFGANICNTIILFSGKIMDMEIGLSMVSLFDPVTKEQVGFTGVLYEYSILLVLIVTDMHQFILRAFIDSYQLIPTAGIVLKSDHLMESMVQFMTDYCVIGFRICLPVFATILLLNSILGILAKVAPQMNMFSVGMQLKILVGLTVLFLTVRLLPGISDFIFTEMKKMMFSFIGGLY